MSEAERLADLLERDPSEWGGLSLGWKAAAELRRLSAELAALKAAMGKPVAWTTGINWHPVAHYQSEQVQKLTRKEQPEHGFIVALHAIPKDKP